MNKSWTVSYAPRSLRPGDTYPVIASFDTLAEAEQAIGLIDEVDAVAVYCGDYEIAGPEFRLCVECRVPLLDPDDPAYLSTIEATWDQEISGIE